MPPNAGTDRTTGPRRASIRNTTAKTRPILRPTSSGSDRLSIARRADGQAVASAAATSGVATKIPMIGKGRAVAAHPAALPAAAMPTHRPSRAASHSLAPRDASMKTSRVLTTKTIRAAVATVPRKSSMTVLRTV